jgi:signal transduction histidine kinase
LRQLFQNLIGNALKFARPGVPLHVVVRAEAFEYLTANADPPPPAGSGWRISVSDNGIGFEQQYAERIFELFQRLHGRTDYEGTGLGLAICRKIAQRHGAIITARGLPGQGATFILDWPAPPTPERTV